MGTWTSTPTAAVSASNNEVFTPFPFQRSDAQRLSQFESSWNFSEMGTGKTYTALELVRQLDCERILVVTTKTGKIPWSLMAPLATSMPVSYDPPRHGTGDHGVFLAHYHLFQNNSKVLQQYLDVEWDMVILDEAHRIKNRNAQWTKNLGKLNTTYRHLMTGSPFANNPSEVWSLLNFLKHDGAKGGFWRFRGHFCEIEVPWHGYAIIKGIKERNKVEFQELLHSQGVRHTKLELFKDLPPIIGPTIVPVELNTTQRRMYDEIKRELSTLDANGVSIDSPTVLSQMSRLRQLTGATPLVTSKQFDDAAGRVVTNIELSNPSSKIDALLELLEGTDNQVVIFSNFNQMLQLLHDRLEKTKMTHIWMRQIDNEHVREQKVDDFQSGKAQIFYNTIKLGSEAITLTAADTVIFLDIYWNPQNNDQCIARVHRKGQTRPTQVIQIQANDSIDGYVKDVERRKHGWFTDVFGSG